MFSYRMQKKERIHHNVVLHISISVVVKLTSKPYLEKMIPQGCQDGIKVTSLGKSETSLCDC